MKILIIEDEAVAAQNLVRMLAEIGPHLEVIDILSSVQQAVAWLNKYPEPDLVFLDIQLSDGLCFEIFEEIALEARIVFTTAFDEYALKAFDVHSVDYLLKPFSRQRIEFALAKALRPGLPKLSQDSDLMALMRAFTKEEPRYKSRFLVKIGKKLMSIPVEEIAYFLKDELIFLITHHGKRYPINHSLGDLESALDPTRFYRLNRQVLVSHSGITAVNTFFKGKLLVTLVAASEQQIVSQERATGFKAWLDQ